MTNRERGRAPLRRQAPGALSWQPDLTSRGAARLAAVPGVEYLHLGVQVVGPLQPEATP
ncbi:MAG: hypothetical protein ABIL09_23145 [Gemmatimonadota bacterium]